jgi:hypothetical protein
LLIKRDDLVLLPVGDQHDIYRWVSLSEIADQSDIHPYTKAYSPYLSNVAVIA